MLTDKTTLQWVKGHVKHPTCLPEQLNCKADTLANEHRQLSTASRGQEVPLMLPTQQVAITLGSTVYTKGIPEQLSQNFYGQLAEQYIQEKNNIKRSALEDIDWEATRKVTRQLSLRERATKAKFTYR